ncbi:hypothetical protein O9992_17985 [Vibrio lentus]|nr:hypothetical protein [Vibrio lentus]
MAKVGLNKDDDTPTDFQRAFIFEVVGSRNWKVLGLKGWLNITNQRVILIRHYAITSYIIKANKALLLTSARVISSLEQDFATATLAKENELLNTERPE